MFQIQIDSSKCVLEQHWDEGINLIIRKDVTAK